MYKRTVCPQGSFRRECLGKRLLSRDLTVRYGAINRDLAPWRYAGGMFGHRLSAAVSLVLLLWGCARNSEAEVRTRLEGWFYLAETLFFNSEQRCTAAAFALNEIEVRNALPVQRLPGDARASLAIQGRTALQIEGYSPNDLIEGLLMMGNGALGKEALAAGAQGAACLAGRGATAAFQAALTQVGATIAYDRDLDGLIVLDPAQGRLFFIAGDVW